MNYKLVKSSIEDIEKLIEYKKRTKPIEWRDKRNKRLYIK